jgi:hypothetical protein
MKRLTAWSLPALLLLMAVGCNKDDSHITGPVSSDQQQKKVETPPAGSWRVPENIDWTKLGAGKRYAKTSTALSKAGVKRARTATDPIVVNGGFEDGDFTGWQTDAYGYYGGDPYPGGFLTNADWYPGWAWNVGTHDPYTDYYLPENAPFLAVPFYHNEVPFVKSGTYAGSALENFPSYHEMYQDVDLPSTGDLSFAFWVRWKNYNPEWLDGVQDIIVTLRDPNSPETVLRTLFKASAVPGLPMFSGENGSADEAFYVQRTSVIRDSQHPLANQTVRLQFDINGVSAMLLVDLDDISITEAVTNHPPVANAGPDQTAECTSHSGASVTLDGSGSSDPDNDALTYAWSWAGGTATGATPTITLPLGSHEITLIVDDGKGGSASDVVVVNVVDTTPPVINLNGPSDVTVECPTPYVELGAVVTDACDPTPSLDITGSVDSHTVGDYTITYTGKDASGNTTVVTRTVKVVDITPPVISSVTATPNSLWPPNHKLVAVTVGVNASDNCGSVTSAIVGVTSSEADNGIGDGNTTNDIQNINGLSVDLRAERSGNGGGRIYTIKVRSADPSGNYAEKTVEVIVPGDNGKKH